MPILGVILTISTSHDIILFESAMCQQTIVILINKIYSYYIHKMLLRNNIRKKA
uniref:Uncharacterized protein n=1 Tax=Papilio polytes TaxID=76194 RepID=I4DSC8_PAPPL|nr:unknown unsecreted protein [Papilio polytes]